ncbi:hypothetical protein GQ457_12G016670 [Hibiscus cannabinus]
MWIKDLTRIYYMIEGSVDRRDRRPAQPSSSRSAQPREPVITDSCRFSPDQAGNPLRPKASPWAVPVLTLEDRHIQPGLFDVMFYYVMSYLGDMGLYSGFINSWFLPLL